jgi:general bacterial porin, GBP family
MKKLLIATAALAMVAGTAQAQSSVSIYGGVGASSNSISTNNVDTPSQFQDQNKDYLGTTNLGFFGTEDLGGGNKAFFRLEGDLSMSGQLGGGVATTNTFTSNASADTAVSKQNTFNRHAHIGIETKDFGTVSFGRQNDSIKDLTGLGQVYNLSDNLHINTQVGSRYAQIAKYASPKINGFKGTYSYSNAPANTTDTTDGTTTLNSFAVTYDYKNYNLGFGQGTLSSSTADDIKTTYFGARAALGAFTVGAHYAMNEQGASELNQTMVSVNYTMGKVDLKAHYVTNDATGSLIGSRSTTNGNGTDDGKGYGLMAAYNLSKRTAAYVGHADFDATTNTYDTKVTTVGVFHKF